MKSILTLVTLICMFTTTSKAALTDTIKAAPTDSLSANYMVGLHPLQLIVNGFKVEVERRASGSPYSFSLSPEFYFGTIEDANTNIMLYANRDVVDVTGFGINLSTRIYVYDMIVRSNSVNYKRHDNQDPFSNFYLFGALEYRYFDLNYSGKGWIRSQENGIDIYKFGDIEQQNSVHRGGLNIGIGNTIFFGDRFFVDFFGYSRISKAFQSPDSEESLPYKDRFFTLSGNSFALGFRFGLLFE
ncbi:MAG: hypothetical protein IPM69_01645 [Ignavibacteria bacterium]|nr:hypothetical protein [Ignavibacteria bacterium]